MSGSVHLADTARFALRRAVLQDFDAMRLLGAETPSAISGRAYLSGSASDSGLVADGRLELGASRIGDVDLESLTGRAVIRHGSGRLSIRSA